MILFSTAKITPSFVLIPIAVVPSLIASIAYFKLGLYVAPLLNYPNNYEIISHQTFHKLFAECKM